MPLARFSHESTVFGRRSPHARRIPVTKAIFAGAVLLTALFVLYPFHRTTAQGQEKPADAGAEFANKFFAINYKQAGQYSSGLLKNVRVVRLGARDFLVGEY